MDGWRNELDYALIVCPIYQLPVRASQIYHQATARDVCIASFSHLGTLVGLSRRETPTAATEARLEMLKTPSAMNPSKDAVHYWTALNRTVLHHLDANDDLWRTEKQQSMNALAVVKEEGVAHLASERDKTLAMSHQEALRELVRLKRFDERMDRIRGVGHGTLLEHR